MSLRYCWERYAKNVKYAQNTRSVGQVLMDVNSAQEIMVATGYTFDSTTGLYTLKSPITSDVLYDATSDGTAYINARYCFCPNGTSSDTTILGYSDESCVFKFTKVTSGFRVECRFSTSDPAIVYFTERYRSISITKGDKIDDVIGTAQSQYPADGVSGDYWYVYQGSDNIDPSISYGNKQTLTKEVTIALAPSASIQYGGTITYDYQVNIDGTNWVDIGSTTATSMNYTIPATATQFQARVRARDNMGFTSTTWVTGPLATVAPPYIRTRLRRKNASGTYDLIHLMTSADSVVQDDGSNVQDIINNIKQRLNIS